MTPEELHHLVQTVGWEEVRKILTVQEQQQLDAFIIAHCKVCLTQGRTPSAAELRIALERVYDRFIELINERGKT